MIADAKFETGHIRVRDGLSLFYRDYPGSPGKAPLLCLHGLTRNSRDFLEFAERYSPQRRVITPDFRGRGLSDYDPLPARYTPLTYATDVIELLDQLGIEEAVFVGTSLGGLVTMAVAAVAPQRIAASILNDVGPELTDAGLERIRTYVGKDIRFASWAAAAAAIKANNKGLPAGYSDEDWLKMAWRSCREEDGQVVFDYDMAIAVPFMTSGAAPSVDLWPVFNMLGAKPLLLVRGAESDLVSADALARMHAAVPDMQSVTIPGVGHAPMLDEPEAVAAIDASLGGI
ncbi:MAG TPA: alpha/beta hydrolase [Sphingomicrobium sp.]|jgi:pimeloyl-ACP methyl ester carboxylesterase